jgi:hypothetical protein
MEIAWCQALKIQSQPGENIYVNIGIASLRQFMLACRNWIFKA